MNLDKKQYTIILTVKKKRNIEVEFLRRLVL